MRPGFRLGLKKNCYLCDMIILSILQSVEFYVIAVVIAAAIVAAMSIKPTTGAVREILLGSTLSTEDADAMPSIELECREDGSVVLTRRGLRGITEAGAVSANISIKGFEVSIEERTVPGNPAYSPAHAAVFILDFMGAEHYFISYRSSHEDLFAALTLHNRPGIRVSKALQ